MAEVLLHVQPGIWEHFKGNRYQVLGTSTHSETGERCVVYRKLYDDYAIFHRPVLNFLEQIDRPEYAGPRFWIVEPDFSCAETDTN